MFSRDKPPISVRMDHGGSAAALIKLPCLIGDCQPRKSLTFIPAPEFQPYPLRRSKKLR